MTWHSLEVRQYDRAHCDKASDYKLKTSQPNSDFYVNQSDLLANVTLVFRAVASKYFVATDDVQSPA